ncbi:hypothetical protein O6H91_23G054400 [Diphasiastrum complanatum]|uniref:Uncharacterized protein n=2 Tax=Diphasiastrum complanatum TaxID=34168 RepID=A0ACC2AB16_DIPCM|nr:hypothetical protein O6H91_23G054200 [Diphasiastrum complanatum]KAJ7514658.1 hypothetical protein O6H91_23G054400 [Diphasiastrum complanatum]
MDERHLPSDHRIFAEASPVAEARKVVGEGVASQGAGAGTGTREEADDLKQAQRWCLPWPSLCRRRRKRRESREEGRGGGGGGSRGGSRMTESKARGRAQESKGRASLQGLRRKSSGELPLPEEIDDLIKEGLSASGAAGQSLRQLRLSPGRLSPVVNYRFDAAMPMAAAAAGYFTHSKSNGGLFHTGSASPPVDKIKSSSSLFEMMAQEQEMQKLMQQGPISLSASQQQNILPPTKQLSVQEKVNLILAESSCENQFNDAASSDLKLTLTGKDGFSVSVNVHRHILTTHSRFFAARLSDRWSRQQRSHPHAVEISDCNNVELYLKTVRLMYCRDLKRTLMKENVMRVLDILKVSAAIVFEAGVASCLEYLEAMPWAEEEEPKVVTMISQLQLGSISAAAQVLKRISITEDGSGTEDVLVRLLQSVIKGTDEKARREMKALVSKLLQENVAQNKEMVDMSKESLYLACNNCLNSLLQLFMQVTNCSFGSKEVQDRGSMVTQIARQADNLHWLIDILIEFHIADDFVRIWAHQSELATLHAQLPIMYRYGVSRLTARLCVGIGKGSIWAPKEVRFLLLQTWLQPLVDDFGWMQRCCKAIDRHEVEEGISQTILTLPMKQQQSMLLAWFDRFSSSGDDCPNLHKAFEVWWRRTFVRPCLDDGVATAR